MNTGLVYLVAKKIIFKRFSIIYEVSCEEKLGQQGFYPVMCPSDIFEKDLILKPTFISQKEMKVIYTPSNVTPEFYEKIFDKTISNYEEYYIEKEFIYDIGEVVGVIVVTDLE